MIRLFNLGMKQVSNSKRVRQLYLSLVLFLFAMVIPAMASEPIINLYSAEDGMSGNIVNCIVKDASGYIWISEKDNTVSRFDGHGFTNYPPNENTGWNGMQCFRGGLSDLGNGDFLISSRSSIAEYNIRSNRFHDYLAEIYSENPEIQQVEGQCYLHNTTVWFFENTRIRKLEPEKHPASGYKETILQLDEAIGKVTCTQEGPGGELWVGTKTGIYTINHGSDYIHLNRYKIVLENIPAPSQNVWRILFTDKNMWLISNNGVIKSAIQPVDDTTSDSILMGEPIAMDQPEIDFILKYYPLNIVSDGSEYMYIRTTMGIYSYSIQGNSTKRLFSEPVGQEDWQRGHYQFALLYDDRGFLWAGSLKGLLKINLKKKKFHKIISFPDMDNGFLGASTSQVLIDSKKRLWVGTTTMGLYMSEQGENGTYREFVHFMPDHNYSFHFQPEPGDVSSLFDSGITSLFEGSNGNLYVASGINIGKVQQIISNGNKVSFKFLGGLGAISQIVEHTDGKIFFHPSRDPSRIYDPETGKGFPFYLDEKKSIYSYQTVQYTSDQKIYLKTSRASNIGSDGFYELTGDLRFLPGDEPAYYPDRIRQLLDSSDIHSILSFHVSERPDYKEFWIFGDGVLYRYRWAGNLSGNEKPVLIRKYTEREGLKTNIIYEVFEDLRHRIWLTSPNGLFCLNPETDEVERYFREDGLSTSEFYWGKHIDDTGIIYLCSNKGVIYFHPDSIIPDAAPPVFITGMNIITDPLKPGENSPSQQPVMLTKELELSYKQNYISIDYVALDFTNNRELEYRYKLDGLEKSWVYAGDNHNATYAYLRPGNYNFTVIAGNSNGIWNTEGASLGIKINPPPWFSWWAITSYMLLVLFIIGWYRNYLISRSRMITELEIERIEKQKVLDIDEIKSRFFANISHEFRTPLSLILGPVEDVLKNKEENATLGRDQLQLIRKNARRLRMLINQLLDLSKLESGKLQLRVSEGKLTEFVRTVVLSFLSAAESRNIIYTYDLQEDYQPVYYDADKVEKILSNLISNAFKFTSEGGVIHIQLEYVSSRGSDDDTMAEIVVQDSGKGIPQEQQDKIFDRFYQADSSESNGLEGTGIGLSLIKELIDLYKGSITMHSEPGKGSSFKVSLPVSRSRFHKDELIPASPGNPAREDPLQNYPEADIRPTRRESTDTAVPSKSNQPIILVVEDHEDLANYIKKQLENDYHVILSKNGKDGLLKATETIPDLVITDLMMPEMDGLELCQKIKNDTRTSHIPVILLTARADQDSKLEGLQKGADDYLVKPFDSSELQVRVSNLIDLRNKLREKFSSGYFSDLNMTNVSGADDRFLQKVTDIISEHISNDTFTVEMLSELLGMSNSQLYRKLQALVGLTPSLFIRNLRLKRSLVLLENKYDNISVIAYEVGFSDHSYFSKCFRELYGVSPTQYKKPSGTEPAR